MLHYVTVPIGERPNPPAGSCRIEISGTIAGINWANVLWTRFTPVTVPSQSDLDSLLLSIGNAYNSHFKAYRSSSVPTESCSALFYDSSGPALVSETPLVLNGTGAASVLPSNCCVVVSWRIAAHYRGGHPRTYLPGVPDAEAVTSRLLDTTYIANLAASANDFIAAINVLTHGSVTAVELGTVSFVTKKDWREPPIFRPYVAGGATVDQRIDSQRRRLGPKV